VAGQKKERKGSAGCPFSKNDVIDLKIDDIGNEGEGIGHYDGYAVFVNNALPGDKIRALIMKVKKNYAFAKLLEIVNPSNLRVEPKCSISARCGGCNLQHMSYEGQLEYKENKVKNCLVRIGGYDEAYVNSIHEPIIGMTNPFNYRNKAQFPVQQTPDGQIAMGFYAGRTHRIIPTDNCNIQMDESNHIAKLVRMWMTEHNISAYDETSHTGLIRHVLTRIGKSTGQIMVCLVVTSKKVPHTDSLVDILLKETGMTCICLNINSEKTNRILGDKIIPLYGQPYIEDNIGDLCYRISPLSFYQVNPEQTVKLYNTALEYANLTGNEVVWDLYCGIGTISLFLAKKAKQVLGVEIVPEAINDAKVNAQLNGITNATFLTGAAETVAAQVAADELYKDIANPDVIVVDPPRKGCDSKLLETIVNVKPDKVVYVSCDPATLARDVKVLRENGYEMKKWRACDMFGMTGHVETCVLLCCTNS